MIWTPDVQSKNANVVKHVHGMNHELFAVLRGQELTSGRHFPGLTNAAPLP